MLENFYKDILKEDITVLASRPMNGRVQIILDFLSKYGILKQKKIIMFGIDDPSSFYIEKLVSLISKIDGKEIKSYFHPCSDFKKSLHIKESFTKAIKILGSSNIIMCDLAFVHFSIDILDYILEYDEVKNVDIMILNTIDGIIQKSNYEVEEILEKIKKYARKYHTHFIILSNVDRKSEVREKQRIIDINYYEELQKQVNLFTLIYRLKKNNIYINKLELLISSQKNAKIENCYYNEKTNEIEGNEVYEKR